MCRHYILVSTCWNYHCSRLWEYGPWCSQVLAGWLRYNCRRCAWNCCTHWLMHVYLVEHWRIHYSTRWCHVHVWCRTHWIYEWACHNRLWGWHSRTQWLRFVELCCICLTWTRVEWRSRSYHVGWTWYSIRYPTINYLWVVLRIDKCIRVEIYSTLTKVSSYSNSTSYCIWVIPTFVLIVLEIIEMWACAWLLVLRVWQMCTRTILTILSICLIPLVSYILSPACSLNTVQVFWNDSSIEKIRILF